jgi:drug/metabolite transporter superfamily protein YnfA
MIKEGYMAVLNTFGLFIVTAIAEIVGCYLPYLWLKKSASPWVLLPAAASLALFAWLLSLQIKQHLFCKIGYFLLVDL